MSVQQIKYPSKFADLGGIFVFINDVIKKQQPLIKISGRA